MAATTPQAWSSLFADTSSASPTSLLYTEEAIRNDDLTVEQIIEKADSNSSLLVEIVSALNLNHETLLSFGDNDLIQTLRRECQEMADYLSARIWHDSENDYTSNRYFRASSSSTYPGHYGKVAEEAQIAALISSSEKIQVAFLRFDETRDFLQAKEFQREEEDQIRAMHKIRQELMPHPYLDDVDDYARNSSSSSSSHALDDMLDADDLGRLDEDCLYSSGRVSFSRAGIEARRQYLRKSEEPRVWQLDPREDFKVNKMKMKKVDQVEVDRIYKERLLEKSPLNSLHGLTTPMTITPDMLADDDEEMEEEEEEDVVEDYVGQYLSQGGAGTSQAAAEEVKAVDETMTVEDEDGEEILEGVERINNRALYPLPVHDDSDDEDEDEDAIEEDETGILSDDSWEEIPRQTTTNYSSVQEMTQRLGQVSVEGGSLSSSSSTSSFLLTTDAASTPTP